MPMVMVVGGESYSKKIYDSSGQFIKEGGKFLTKNGLINEVELLGFSGERNKCSKFVTSLVIDGWLRKVGTDEDGRPDLILMSETYGLTGVWSKDTAIVCGGKNWQEYRSTCYEWDAKVNK